MQNVAMRRILGLSKKNREQTTVWIEKDLHEIIKSRKMPFSDLVNVSVERYLREEGVIKSEG